MSTGRIDAKAFIAAVNDVMLRQISEVIYRYSARQFRIMLELISDDVSPEVRAKIKSALIARLDADIQICRENIGVEKETMKQLIAERNGLK